MLPPQLIPEFLIRELFEVHVYFFIKHGRGHGVKHGYDQVDAFL